MSRYGSASYRFRTISRQGVSAYDANLCKARLESARDSGLVDAFDRTVHDGAELTVMMDASRLSVCDSTDFEEQCLLANRVIDKAMGVYRASDRPKERT